MNRAIRAIVLLTAAVILGGCLNINARAPERINIPAYRDDTPPPPPPGGGPPPPPHEQGDVPMVGYDTLAHVGKPVQLAAWNSALAPGAEVGFYHNQVLIARGRVDASGYARAAWTPPAEGVYTLTARPMAGRGGGLLVVSALRPDAPLVVVDLDYAIVASRAKRTWLGQSKALTGSASALAAVARTSPVVYLTRDSEELGQATKNWLNQAGFPPGPILLSSPSADPFKSAQPGALTANFPRMRAAVIGKTPEAEAFAARSVPTYLLVRIDDNDAKDLRKKAREIRQLPRGVSPATTWNEIETGIARGAGYSADALADKLERQAEYVDRKKKKD